MTRPVDPAFRCWVDAARAVPIGALADALGLTLTRGTERVGPCPDCGGHDRFGLNTRKRVFHCRRCGAKGDVIGLVRLLDRCSFVAACETLTGSPPPDGPSEAVSAEAIAALEREREEAEARREEEAERFREAERRSLWRWWQALGPAAGSPVEAYLALRRLSLPPCAPLRFDPDARLWDRPPPQGRVVHRGPAKVAAFRRPDGRFGGLHVTWIDLADPKGQARVPDPETGEFLPAKKVRGSQRAGRVELVSPRDPVRLVMGEGDETTLSLRDALIEAGRDLAGTAFWSALNLGNLGGPHAFVEPHPTMLSPKGRPVKVPGRVPALDRPAIPVPDSVREIVLLGDGDSDPFAVACALERAATRYARPGRTVRAATAPESFDFNDLRRPTASESAA